MDLFQSIILALIQGLSEFLPISSSAHLILPSQLFGWEDQGLAFDVAVHLGSLLAVIVYFRRQLLQIIESGARQIGRRQLTDQQYDDARLGWFVLLATIPTVTVALFAKDFIELHFRSTTVIATTTILFGLLLGGAEWQARRNRQVARISLHIALLVGVAQIFALVPGTSRSGVTITAAVFLGLSRTEAARFSFLLSIPIILAASVLLSVDLLTSKLPIDWAMLSVGVLVSGISAWVCIASFLRLIERIGFMPFVVYRLMLGAILLTMI